MIKSVLGVGLAALLLWIESTAIAAAGKGLDPEKISAAAGAKATVTADGIVRLAWPRDDVPLRVDGVAMKPFAGVGSWAAFTATGSSAMMMGDTVVFQDEVTPALEAAFASGLEVTAIHNHFLFDEPKVLFMHIGGHGSSEQLAAGVKSVWAAIKAVRAKAPLPGSRFPGPDVKVGTISPAPLQQVFGTKPDVKDGMIKFTIGRDVTMHHAKVGGSMGVTTWAAFLGSDGAAAVDGDFVMSASEVQPVLRALTSGGINIVALHNHMIGEEPALYFTHFWGKGPALTLAKVLKSALDAQKSAAKHPG